MNELIQHHEDMLSSEAAPSSGGAASSAVSLAAQARASMTPTERIKENSELVRILAPEIQREHLAGIQGKEFMCVGGGIAIANAMGYAISVGPVTFDKDLGCFQATASMTNGLTDKVVASAVGYVGDDETRWTEGPKFARNSMTQTRAEAKLCRINFGHLYTLLGASTATPAEEMMGVEYHDSPARPARKAQAPARAPAAATTANVASPGGDPPQGAEWTLESIVLKNKQWNIHTLTMKQLGGDNRSGEGQVFDMFDPDLKNLEDARSNGWPVKVTWVKGKNFEQYGGYNAKQVIILKPSDAAMPSPSHVPVLNDEEVPF